MRRQAELPAPLETVAEGSGSESESTSAAGSVATEDHTRRRDRDKDAPALPSYPFANTSGTPHYPARLQKSTSSLATNLASARGIPQVRGSTPGTGTPGTSSPSASSRRRRPPALHPPSSDSAKPTTNPLTLLPPDQPAPSSPTSAASHDASFSKFYSSLNSLITRIGSPFTASLAFTGLPVGTGPNDNEITPDVLPKGWTQGRGRGRNLLDNLSSGGGESFYVVPYSGGTMSYAGVVRRDSNEDTEKDKLPRRSRVPPPPQSSSPTPSSRDEETARFAGHDKTLEELQLENVTLRRTLEQLSRNMNKWQRKTREGEKELKSSIMALSRTPAGADILSQAQRRSWLHLPTTTTNVAADDDDDDADTDTYSEGRRIGELELVKEEARERVEEMDEHVRALQRELRERDAEIERVVRDNEKLRDAVGRYREKWDTLKEGAKKRERNGKMVGSGGNE